MNLLTLVAAGGVLLYLGYRFYGATLAKVFELNDKRVTPANKLKDGEDFVPVKARYLLGQHFSAIAAAGPIVGPILAGLTFGWLPAVCWIIVGAIFVGGVHDLSALVASIRHQGRSIADVVREHMSRRSYILFLVFIWMSLVYVIIAFTDVTASTFVSGEEGKGVASASMLYLLVAVVMGLVIRKTGLSEERATFIFLPFVLVAIWLGSKMPLVLPETMGMSPVVLWDRILLIYCFVAALTPMWALLQPRGALGGYFLYASILVAVIGLLVSGATVQWPALRFPEPGGAPLPPIFPLLFVTVACGACSGFHSIVSSGTTSKQLNRESDARPVGYGGMLLEGFVALLALSTLMMLVPGSEESKRSPNMIYASGIGSFLSHFGIPREQAVMFGLLAFATFVYDTLDVCTRLGRYIFQELTGLKGHAGAVLATLATLALPWFAVTLKVTDAAGNLIPVWRLFWTLFGASNQLLAALTLLGVTVWMKRNGKPIYYTAIPMAFMMIMTLWALVRLATPWVQRLLGSTLPANTAEGATSATLIVLALLVLGEAIVVLGRPVPREQARVR